MKLCYNGPVVNAGLLLVMLEKHGIHATQEFFDPAAPDDNDLSRPAQVFAAALGLSRDDAAWLRDQLLLAAKNSDCAVGWWNLFPAAHHAQPAA